MDDDLLDRYERSSEWAATKVAGAADRLGEPTPCDDWDVRALLNHIIDTQHYFAGPARHGWDLAASTSQDTTMPSGVARVVYDMIHGRFTEEQRKGIFKPELPVPADASDQDRLLAYTGRNPATARP
jgi:hypothetical protein